MSQKNFVQVLLIFTILLASFSSVGDVKAWSSCGRTVTVQWGDTLSHIANLCNTTVAAIRAANPGLGYYIYAGQVLVMPGGGYSYSSTGSYSNTYIVRSGDTFAKIAGYYGVNVNTLWAYNPQIWNINYIYAGQVIYVPGTSSWSGTTTYQTYDTPAQLSYGAAPEGAPTGRVKLTNNANADVYISLQGTTKEGVKVINEYTVNGSVTDYIPAGWYLYVAWVGGKKFSGNFQLYGDGNVKISIYSHKITVN